MSSKVDLKYDAAALFMVSSTPKQHAYWMPRIHELRLSMPARAEPAAVLRWSTPSLYR